MRPLQYPIYKGVGGKFGALQFNLQHPHYYGERGSTFEGQKDFTGNRATDNTGKIQPGWKQREGAVFIEACSAKGKNEYDWENKITFACSVDDMGKLMLSLSTGAALDIMHDPGAKSSKAGQVRKHVKLFSKGITTEGAMMTVTETKNGETKEHRIPLSPAECLNLRELFRAAVVRSLNW